MLSSGPHTNGYSLIRKILLENEIGNLNIHDLVKPHKSYLEEVRELNELGVDIHGLCHITGGGYYGNLKRVLPHNLALEITVPILEPFATLQRLGNVSNRDMYSIFNCGYGMLFFVSPENKEIILRQTHSHYLGEVFNRGLREQISIK